MSKEEINKLEELSNRFNNIEKLLTKIVEKKNQIEGLDESVNDGLSESSYDELKASGNIHKFENDDTDPNEGF